jgi:DNA replication protein DnaD
MVIHLESASETPLILETWFKNGCKNMKNIKKKKKSEGPKHEGKKREPVSPQWKPRGGKLSLP